MQKYTPQDAQMDMLSVSQSLELRRDYVEFLRGHVDENYLQKCEAILANVESHLDELITTPLPRSATELKMCIACVLQNIAGRSRTLRTPKSMMCRIH